MYYTCCFCIMKKCIFNYGFALLRVGIFVFNNFDEFNLYVYQNKILKIKTPKE